MEWEEFKKEFMENVSPNSVREAKVKEFETMEQRPHMSVVEYHLRFTQLSHYAPQLIPYERHKIQRFVEGLNLQLYNTIGG